MEKKKVQLEELKQFPLHIISIRTKLTPIHVLVHRYIDRFPCTCMVRILLHIYPHLHFEKSRWEVGKKKLFNL